MFLKVLLRRLITFIPTILGIATFAFLLGPGIPEDQYKNVFKPFFRLDKSRSLNQSGVGLGLAIVEDVINSHGGSIQLGKSKHNGLQVKISLPF